MQYTLRLLLVCRCYRSEGKVIRIISAFHEHTVIANEVKQSMAPEFMDCRGLRPRNDDAGSWSVCGFAPELLARKASASEARSYP